IQRASAEENPRKGHEHKNATLLEQFGNPLTIKRRALQLPRDNHAQAVQRAPDHKSPVRAVPDAGNEKRDEEISIREPGASGVSAERDIDVITKPRRKTDVPALPEFAQACREVWIVEVQNEIKPHELRDAAGHVRVATEVKEDLPAKCDRREN